jgi:hypothetical protein
VSGFSADIAAKVRSNWATEMDTDTPLAELLALALALVLVLVLADVDEELLHAAAARHKASDADTTTAPFLTV